MPALTLYFNDLSAPLEDVTSTELQNWATVLSSLMAGLKKVVQYQGEYALGFPKAQLSTIYAEKPFVSWLKEWVDRDQYRWLLTKAEGVELPDDVTSQVYLNDRPTIGLSLACLANSWAFSFPTAGSPWLVPTIRATECRLGGTDQDCSIKHLANEEHAVHWGQTLGDWGREIATNNTIGNVAGNRVVMYPLDHGYPHVHMVDGRDFRNLAKFRVDHFERIQGEPRWDGTMHDWVEFNRAELIRSWERCQNGGHPYRITDECA